MRTGGPSANGRQQLRASAPTLRTGLLRLVPWLTLSLLAASCRQRHDTLITHVRLIDGSGTHARDASVRFRDGRILDVGELQPATTDSIVDGQGMTLAPGFIDAHSHHLGHALGNPASPATASQGITTIVIGQDGSSEPMDSLAHYIANRRLSVNIASYTGQTSLREQAMGKDQLLRNATPAEIERMKGILRRELAKGSLGLSTGLEYEGAFYSSKEEVLELARTAAKEGGRYISHLRSEDLKLDEALREIIDIGRITGMPVQISHIKIADHQRWGQADSIIAALEKARAEGVEITADIYPYTFWNSTLRVLFPDKRFTDIRSAQLACDRLFDPYGSMIARFLPDTTLEGLMLGAIARIRRETPAQTLLYLVATADAYRKAHPDGDGVEAIAGSSMREADVQAFTRWKQSVICSDGNAGRHPRGYGAFPRVLGRYVREAGLLSIEEAVHKMTGLTAKQLGIPNRGLVKAGYAADLVLFDPATIIDNATLDNSHAPATGILKVWVNGSLVLDGGKTTGAGTGQLIRR
jgi:N-acyl-D-aspartate/D-glutamate deacylase